MAAPVVEEAVAVDFEEGGMMRRSSMLKLKKKNVDL